MAKFAGLAAVGVSLLLLGCTPPTPKMSLEEAMVACRAKVSKPVETKAGLGLTLGSGGKITPSASISVGIDLSAANAPEKAFENCVMRNSGQSPTEPFNEQEPDA